MTNKTYRSAMGKPVDMGALVLRNERVRAVGNMGVNARGDLVDGNNQPLKSRKSAVAKQYQKQTVSNVSDEPVKSQAPVVTKEEHKKAKARRAAEKSPAPTTGLAAAMARAQQNDSQD